MFPAEAPKPVRIEFFGDEIESIRRFDVETQRSILKLDSVLVLPLVEHPRSRALLRQLAEALGGESDDLIESRAIPSRDGNSGAPVSPRTEMSFR